MSCYVDTGYTDDEYEAFGLADTDRFLRDNARRIMAAEDDQRRAQNQKTWAELCSENTTVDEIRQWGRVEAVRRDIYS